MENLENPKESERYDRTLTILVYLIYAFIGVFFLMVGMGGYMLYHLMQEKGLF